MVLDELGTWFNSRSWQDKERLPVINWFPHARKLHWDIYFIVQSISVIDTQLSASLAEYVVDCKRNDRLSIQIIGYLLNLFGLNKILPQIHVARVFYGNTNRMLVGRWWYRGTDLYACYDTAQIFTDRWEVDQRTGAFVDRRATYSLLRPYHLNRIAICEDHEARAHEIRQTAETASRATQLAGT
ncbi:MAG: zonular occludens toxin domain-containing protein, partial [Methylococcales bacterium]